MRLKLLEEGRRKGDESGRNSERIEKVEKKRGEGGTLHLLVLSFLYD